jgi:hypothetical protein
MRTNNEASNETVVRVQGSATTTTVVATDPQKAGQSLRDLRWASALTCANASSESTRSGARSVGRSVAARTVVNRGSA